MLVVICIENWKGQSSPKNWNTLIPVCTHLYLYAHTYSCMHTLIPVCTHLYLYDIDPHTSFSSSFTSTSQSVRSSSTLAVLSTNLSQMQLLWSGTTIKTIYKEKNSQLDFVWTQFLYNSRFG